MKKLQRMIAHVVSVVNLEVKKIWCNFFVGLLVCGFVGSGENLNSLTI